MIKLIKKGICIALSLIMLAGIPTFPAHAAERSAYDFRYFPGVTGHQAVPVGAQIRFQTPPLKKNEKLCYTAGNGEILHTFIAGKPIENADGTVRYRLGYKCCKEGETGIYFNWNGKKHMLDSVRVVNDKSETGFPISTFFGRIFANQKVEKIVVENGNTGESRQTTNSEQIIRLMATLAPEKLYRNCNPQKGLGFLFNVHYYFKGQKGDYRYSICDGFYKSDGFEASLPAGSCVEENAEEVFKIIGNFYDSLG